MGFKDLERSLKNYYQKASRPEGSEITKRRVKFEALEAFREQKQNCPVSLLGGFWDFIISPKLRPAYGFAALALVIGSFFGGGSNATLVALDGLVTVSREGQDYIIKDSFVLLPGDVVETASSARGQIVSQGRFVAGIGSNAEVRYTNHKDLFVQHGDIQADLWKKGSIVTDRGEIHTPSKGTLMVSVSQSGETQVVLQDERAYVQDWKKGRQILSVGDSVRFRTDTVLAQREIPTGLSLSLDQILALRSQFSISRTKAVNALEQLALSNPDKANKQLTSAEKTFRSAISVLKSDRSLKVQTETDVNVFSNEDVLVLLKERSADKALVEEAQALSQLFALVESKPAAFSEEFTGLNAFDRYRMLDRAFALVEEGSLGEVLKQKYAIAFLQDIQNQELAVSQQKILEKHLALLPKTATASEFLDRVSEMSDPKLAKLLKKKQKALFS